MWQIDCGELVLVEGGGVGEGGEDFEIVLQGVL